MTRYGSWSLFDGRRKLSGGWISEQDAIDEMEREKQRRAGTYKREPLVLRDFKAEFKAEFKGGTP